MAADESGMKRFLCSDLAVLSAGARRCFVNLEEIWRTGAVLECEEEWECGAALLVFESGASVPQKSLHVAIESVEKHEFGWRLEARFVDGEWTPEFYTPAHLTDVENLAAKAGEGERGG